MKGYSWIIPLHQNVKITGGPEEERAQAWKNPAIVSLFSCSLLFPNFQFTQWCMWLIYWSDCSSAWCNTVCCDVSQKQNLTQLTELSDLLKAQWKRMKQKVSGAKVHISKEAWRRARREAVLVRTGRTRCKLLGTGLQSQGEGGASGGKAGRHYIVCCRRLKLYGWQHRESLNAGAVMRELARIGQQSALDLRAVAGKRHWTEAERVAQSDLRFRKEV